MGGGSRERGLGPPRGHLTMSADNMDWLSQLGVEDATGSNRERLGIWQNPTIHRTSPQKKKNYLAYSVNSAEVEKSWSRRKKTQQQYKQEEWVKMPHSYSL